MDIPEITLLTVAAWSSGYLDTFDFWNTVMRLVVYFLSPVVVIIQPNITPSFGYFIELPTILLPQLSLPQVLHLTNCYPVYSCFDKGCRKKRKSVRDSAER